MGFVRGCGGFGRSIDYDGGGGGWGMEEVVRENWRVFRGLRRMRIWGESWNSDEDGVDGVESVFLPSSFS